ncbi:MAG: hypothetical protein HY561_12470 [Gemmatimonadetes bacterium]|nr:hypothetical protein [Gemmatimonadota bacterium]
MGGRALPLGATAAAVAILVFAAPRPARGQIDYRNLDDDRPTFVEDAYAAEAYAFEVITPYLLERERDGTFVHASVLELEYGIVRNAHVGIKVPVALRREAGSNDWGLSGIRVFGLYNFNTESPLLPAFSLRGDAALPVGSLAGSDARISLKAIATRSFGRTRIHMNAAYAFGPDGTPAVVESLPRWWVGVAADRTFFRESILVIGEVYVLREEDDARVEVNVSAGLRYQWRPTTVIDVGVARGLREDLGPDYALTVGITNAFAIAVLMAGIR